MNKKMIRRVVAAVAVLSIALGTVSCSKKGRGGALKIGISKITAHPALDAVEQGIIDRLTESGREVSFDQQNANSDVNTAAQIAAQFQNERVDAAVGIATPTAVALANTIKEIPVVFSAVTDPVRAGLVDTIEHGKNNVTGASDAITVADHIDIFRDIAGIKRLGYIYTSSEDNSISSFADLREACAERGIEIVEQAITASAELRQAAESIIGRVDGIYITNDNTVYNALPSLIQVCHNAKKPLFSVDVTSCLGGGAVIAVGWDYYKIGRVTGEMVLQIVDGTPPAKIPVRFLDALTESDFMIDLDEAANCGITVPEGYIHQANKIFQNGALTEK